MSKKIVDVEEALQAKPAVASQPEPEPEVTFKFTKVEQAWADTVLPGGKVIKWQREKRPDGRITRWGTFETTDEKVAEQLEKLGPKADIHRNA